MPEVYVAAGSNVNPLDNLRRALDELEQRFGALRISGAYRNRPVGFEGADFVNLVLGFASDRSLESIVTELHTVEALCGRPRQAPKWGPRAMDLDVLLYGDAVGELAGCVLPRPDLVRRAYMLGPLAEIAPALRHPVLGRTMAELWREFPRNHHPLTRIELAREAPPESRGNRGRR